MRPGQQEGTNQEKALRAIHYSSPPPEGAMGSSRLLMTGLAVACALLGNLWQTPRSCVTASADKPLLTPDWLI